MDMKEYVEKAMITNVVNYKGVIERINDPQKIDLIHAAMGINTESGELTDALKKYAFYGKPIDEVNLKEEIGDLFWYIAQACTALNISFEECMVTNIEKLQARYGGKFTEEKANNRDLTVERETLEK